MTTDDSRLALGAVVNAFFNFSQHAEGFDQAATQTAQPVTVAPAPPRTVPPSISTTPTNLETVSGDGPAPWSKKSSSVVIDASHMQSLDASLKTILKPLTPKQQLNAMTDIFAYVYTAHCVESKPQKSNKSHRYCYLSFHHPNVAASAHAYLGDGRMDANYAYVVTSLAAGSAHYGRNRVQSFTYFIHKYGKYIDQVTVKELSTRIEDMRAKASVAVQGIKMDDLNARYTKLARWEANLTRMPAKAASAIVLKTAQKNCQIEIDFLRQQIEFIQSNDKNKTRPVRTERQSTSIADKGVAGSSSCDIIHTKSGLVILDPNIKPLAEDATKEQKREFLRKMLGISY